jgi:hypothetical protein
VLLRGVRVGALTDIQIKQWIKSAAEVAKADGGGLTFTLSKAGRAAWVLRYRFGGKRREKTLGQYPCHRPAHRSQLMIGTMEPEGDRHIGATP